MTYLVGIAGVSGSGKGTIAGLVKDHLTTWGLACFIFSTDDCYNSGKLKKLSDKERDALCFNPKENFDHPEMVDFRSLIVYAQKLKSGHGFDFPPYDFQTHSYSDERIQIPDGLDVAVIEGIYALYSGQEVGDELISLYDHRLFVVTTPGIAQNRRIRRDIEERGRNPMHILKQLDTTVIPMQEKYILPTRTNADDIVDWRTDETQDPEEAKRKLIGIVRERALAIYEAVKGPLLPELDIGEIKIPILSLE